jgi:hypothetical protein
VRALVLLAVACGHAAAIDAPDERVLAVREEEMSAESDIAYEVTIEGFVQPRQWWMRTAWKREVAVLATRGEAVTRVRVTYHAHDTAAWMSGSDRVEAAGALAGRSFVVDAAGERVEVSDADGGDVPRAVAELVRADHRWLGKRDPILALLARTRGVPGEVLAIDEGLLAATVGDVPPEEFRGTATVRRTELDAAGARILELDLELASESDDDGRFRIGNRLTGTLLVDLDHRRAVSLTASGAIHRFEKVRRATKPSVVGSGAGHAKLSWTARYR